jgi:hypothetical protein
MNINDVYLPRMVFKNIHVKVAIVLTFKFSFTNLALILVSRELFAYVYMVENMGQLTYSKYKVASLL